MEEERQKHASDAEKMKRKQAKIQEEAARKQEVAEKVHNCLNMSITIHTCNKSYFSSKAEAVMMMQGASWEGACFATW